MGSTSDSEPTKDPSFWTNFKQQSLPVWTPRYNTQSVSPLLIGFGIVIIPIGIAVLLITSDGKSDMKEKWVDYTDCMSLHNESMSCAEFLISRMHISNKDDSVCQCDVEFELEKPIKGEKIYMYYSLENFHQNVRRFVKSRDDAQLLGKLGTLEEPYEPKDCAPFDKDLGKIIFPCGAIANSMFNDTIQLYFSEHVEGEVEVKQIRRGIAWPSDIQTRFKNPPEFSDPGNPIWDKFTKPKGWSRTIWDLDPTDPDNNGVQNEDLIVWMRPAALSNFLKLYRIIIPSNQDTLNDRLPAGKYHIKVNYTYEVASFHGRKGIVLSRPTIFGQHNLFQGISAISIGGVSVIMGLLFLLCGFGRRHGKGSFSQARNASAQVGL